jgi:hypothetical protein
MKSKKPTMMISFSSSSSYASVIANLPIITLAQNTYTTSCVNTHIHNIIKQQKNIRLVPDRIYELNDAFHVKMCC